jgi:serine protein kinase
MLTAIGSPDIVDTTKDPRQARLFSNRTIKVYPAFKDFYGIEDAIARVVGFFVNAAQGMTEAKQILHLLGPVGSSKSTLATRLADLMETQPIYVLVADGKVSPLFESPLGLFNANTDAEDLLNEYGIPKYALIHTISPWALKRLNTDFGGDITKFTVRKIWPSKHKQIAIGRVEAGDPNTQDVTCLVGKVDIRQLEQFSQNDPDAYSFSGGLCIANQGICEMVEVFKTSATTLNPLLSATAEFQYAGSEPIGQLPWTGLLLSHCNEAEWKTFSSNKRNEAFIDRMSVIKIPYTLRATEEAAIYKKLLDNSALALAPCAPHTLELLARFAVLSRLHKHPNSTQYDKLRVYNGDSIKDTAPKAKSMQEYKEDAGEDEGMTGISTRFAFKVLAAAFNFSTEEKAADPVHLFLVLEQNIKRAQYPDDKEKEYMTVIREELAARYAEDVGKEIQTAYVESYSSYGQSIFERYLLLADAWIEDSDFKDPDTGQMLNRSTLNDELSVTEKAAGIASPKDFRNEVVKFALRYRAANAGKNPHWTAYQKIKEAIESRIFSSLEDLLPVISFGAKQDAETAEKHQKFVDRMIERGYTERQVRRLTEWYMRVKKSN